MKLKELLANVSVLQVNTDLEQNIDSVEYDSRKVTPGSLFVAITGFAADGNRFIPMALEKGAVAVVTAVKPEENIPYILVKSDRLALAQIGCNFFGNPSKEMTMIGVTGTNGKTSIATLLYNLFTDLGYSCGLLSTIANYIDGKQYEAVNTTPGPMELNRLLAQMCDAGCEFCFMEASSHAIDQQRIEGIEFAGAIFTNLTHDHLDYHKTFANYLSCKKRLFDILPKSAFALTNIDDRNGEVMVQNTKAEIKRYSCRNWADFNVKILEKTIEGMLLKINGKEVWCRFIGTHNASNLTAVYGAAILLGGNEDEVITAMSRLTSVAGRLEYFKGEDDIIAAVDYAHTPDALENVLKTLKELEPCGDLICVFGCGGNRDKTKRPEMGAIATKYATRVIVTSDNPRFEDPNEIIADIKSGMDIKGKAKSLFITDRSEAIKTAVLTAKPGSIVLVAGKGHEDYQIIGGVKHHLDDKEIINEAFEMQREAKNQEN